MEATELRINNYVLDSQTNEIIQIYSIDQSFVNSGQLLIGEDIKPIPLTEEWLLKFGWIWNKNTDSYEKCPDFDNRMFLSKSTINYSYTMFNFVLKSIIAKNIFFVHQLQNLYFALTGEELTIKENAIH